MPYFVTGEGEAGGCSGYAVVKSDGEVMGCHTTKQAAIDQMVAISIAEGMEPGGEYSQRQLPDNYRPALAPDVPDGRACGNCYFYNEDLIRDDMAFCEKWNEYVRGDHYCNAWQPDEEDRAVKLITIDLVLYPGNQLYGVTSSGTHTVSWLRQTI